MLILQQQITCPTPTGLNVNATNAQNLNMKLLLKAVPIYMIMQADTDISAVKLSVLYGGRNDLNGEYF